MPLKRKVIIQVCKFSNYQTVMLLKLVESWFLSTIDFHLTGWNNIEIIIFTHSLGGLTENDFILAKKLTEIPVQYSKKFLTSNPNFSV